MKTKKGQIGTLQNLVISLVTIGIILGIGLLVLGEFKDQMDAGSEEANATNLTIYAIGKIPSWLSIIVILAIVGILLSIVFSVLPRGGGSTAQI